MCLLLGTDSHRRSVVCLLLGGVTIFGAMGAVSDGVPARTTVPDAAAPVAFATRSWTASNFPNPQKDPAACGLKQSGWICDPDHILEDATRLAIQERLDHINAKTKYVLAVALLRDLRVNNFAWVNLHPRGYDLERFAGRLLARWGIGDGTNGPGVMLTVVPHFHSSLGADTGVAVTAETEAADRGLSDELCKGIADYGVWPYVASGTPDRGVVSGVEEIAFALRRPQERSSTWLLTEDNLFKFWCAVAMASLSLYICRNCCSLRGDYADEPPSGHEDDIPTP